MNLKDAELLAITPLDGRYRSKIEKLAEIVSEAGLIRQRLRVEAGWLLWLLEQPVIGSAVKVSASVKHVIEAYFNNPPLQAAAAVKEIEKETNHDVKAVEYHLRSVLQQHGAPSELLCLIHFACTSEDINNLSYAMMLREARDRHVLPAMDEIIGDLAKKAHEWAEVGMLSRTHGQSATPTTVGKELAVFAHRLLRQRDILKKTELYGKMNGAVGNYNAHLVAYPELDWEQISRGFIEDRLGLKQNPLTTQIENHDSMIEYFDAIKRFNSILIGFARDMWSYISLGYFKQKSNPKEVGSSTMPHKVNPIDFENAEGNLGVANAIAQHYGEKLLISRWQRDLTDSTVQRTVGTMLGHTLLSYQSLLRGLGKLQLDINKVSFDLDQAWEVLAEPIQTVMRRYGVSDAYERLKAETRGAAVSRSTLERIIRETAEIPEERKESLLHLTPGRYLGIAEKLARDFYHSWQQRDRT
jgi:adenylosuccinate lyase